MPQSKFLKFIEVVTVIFDFSLYTPKPLCNMQSFAMQHSLQAKLTL